MLVHGVAGECQGQRICSFPSLSFMLVILRSCDSCFSFRHLICSRQKGDRQGKRKRHQTNCSVSSYQKSKCFFRTVPSRFCLHLLAVRGSHDHLSCKTHWEEEQDCHDQLRAIRTHCLELAL